MVAGRALTDDDVPAQPGPQILNILVTRDLADALFPDGDALGKTVDTGSEEYPDLIVGVLDHMLTPYGGGPMESRITFYPGKPGYDAAISYVVRTEPGEVRAVLPSLEPALLATQADRTLQVQTLAEIKGAAYLQNRLVIRVLSSIVFLLLFVTGLGIYGVTSFSVTQRTKQVGTRRALGASRAAIVRYFLLEAALVTALGSTLGLAGAYGLNLLLVTRLGSAPLHADLAIAGTALLWLLILSATVLPARRAAGLSPALATRSV